MRTVLTVVAIGALLYLLLIVALWAGQERIVWQPPRTAAIPDARAQRLDYAADDGQPLYAYLVGDPVHAPGTLVAFHGNAELAAWNVDWATEVTRRTGWAVLLPEYRGYGGLPGAPSHAGSARDADATWRLATDQLGVDGARLAYYGHSLGTAVAADLAARHRPAALVMLAPFTSVRDMARAMPGLPLSALWGLIGRVRFDTRAIVGTLDAPVWVAHGARDLVIPQHMGREVHAAARQKGDLLLLPRAGHNDVLLVAEAEYWRWLERALQQAAPARLPQPQQQPRRR